MSHYTCIICIKCTRLFKLNVLLIRLCTFKHISHLCTLSLARLLPRVGQAFHTWRAHTLGERFESAIQESRRNEAQVRAEEERRAEEWRQGEHERMRERQRQHEEELERRVKEERAAGTSLIAYCKGKGLQ